MVIDFPETTRVSHSRIKTWRRCEMQHHYKYYQGLRKKAAARPLVIGTAVHTMIEAQLERGTWEPEFKQFNAEYSKLFQEEQLMLGNLPVEVKAIVERYFDYYREDGLIYPVRRRNRRTELELHIPLTGYISFIGYVDAYPQDEQGRNWLMDHKTCKSIPTEENRFSDLQLLIYNWMLPQLGYPAPDGVIWDYLRTKAPTQPEMLKAGGFSKNKSIDTTYDVYMGTVEKALGRKALKDYEEFAQQLKGREEKFLRRIILPAPKTVMISTVVKDLEATAQEIHTRGPMATVRNMTKDCSWCSFYNLCQAEVRGLDTEHIRAMDYTTEGKDDGNEDDTPPDGESN